MLDAIHKLVIERYDVSVDHELTKEEDLYYTLNMCYFGLATVLLVISGLLGLTSQSSFVFPLCLYVAMESVRNGVKTYKEFTSLSNKEDQN